MYMALHITSVNENDLAQALVEGYYSFLGSQVELPGIVVALTDVGINSPFQTETTHRPPPPPPPRNWSSSGTKKSH